MPTYRVIKPLSVGTRKYAVGESIDLDKRRGDWLIAQHKAVAPIGSVADVPALMKPKPIVHRRCCGR
jgi:hypothetical protein